MQAEFDSQYLRRNASTVPCVARNAAKAVSSEARESSSRSGEEKIAFAVSDGLGRLVCADAGRLVPPDCGLADPADGGRECHFAKLLLRPSFRNGFTNGCVVGGGVGYDENGRPPPVVVLPWCCAEGGVGLTCVLGGISSIAALHSAHHMSNVENHR